MAEILKQINPFFQNIDLSTDRGLKLYKMATENKDGKDKLYDGKESNLTDFLDSGRSQGRKFGWIQTTGAQYITHTPSCR